MPSHQLSLILSLIPRLLLVCTCQLHPFIHSLLSLTEKEEAVELKEREFFYGNHLIVFQHLKIRHKYIGDKLMVCQPLWFSLGFFGRVFEVPMTYVVKIYALICEEGCNGGTLRKEGGVCFLEKLMSLVEE